MVRGLKLRMRDCFIYVVKTKVLMSCLVTAQLICTFVFAYAKSMFSHDVAQFNHSSALPFLVLYTLYEWTDEIITSVDGKIQHKTYDTPD